MEGGEPSSCLTDSMLPATEVFCSASGSPSAEEERLEMLLRARSCSFCASIYFTVVSRSFVIFQRRHVLMKHTV